MELPWLTRWLRRYGPAEVTGIGTALLGSYVVHALTGNEIAAAFGGAHQIQRAEVLVRSEAHVTQRLAVGRFGIAREGDFPRDGAPIHRLLVACRNMLVDDVSDGSDRRAPVSGQRFEIRDGRFRALGHLAGGGGGGAETDSCCFA